MSLVRVSVANLAYWICSQTSQQTFQIGIPNPKLLAKGQVEFQALGGGAQLTSDGFEHLTDVFDASKFERDPRTDFYDARFLVKENRLNDVFSFFTDIAGDKNRYEADPTLDIMAELSGKEFPNLGLIFTPKEADRAIVAYVRTVRQPPPESGRGTSERELADIPSRRMFRLFKIMLPHDLFDKVAGGKEGSSPITLLSDAELDTTHGGTRKGVTHDGKVMRDNLFRVPRP